MKIGIAIRGGIFAGCCLMLAAIGCKNSNNPLPKPTESLVLLAPAGGAHFVHGDTVRIKWQINDTAGLVKGVLLFLNNGSAEKALGNGSFPPGVNSYLWTIDGSIISTQCAIVIKELDNAVPPDSSGVFSIQAAEPAKPIAMLLPKGGEHYKVGDSVNIVWEVNDTNDVSSIVLQFYHDSLVTTLGTNSFPRDSTIFTWVIDSSAVSSHCYMRIKEYNNNVPPDSSGIFTITY